MTILISKRVFIFPNWSEMGIDDVTDVRPEQLENCMEDAVELKHAA
jgi:hypothetical protein